MAIPPELDLEPRNTLSEQLTQARADLQSYAGWSGSYGQGSASGSRLTYDTLTAFVWWTSPRIDDPVRVRLSESLAGIFVDAQLEMTFFGNIDLPLGSSYRIGDELSPAEDLYNFTVAGKSAARGLSTYEGETLLSRLARVVPEGSLVLLPGAGGVPNPLTPAIALERLLAHFGIPHGPIPDLLIRIPDGTLELHMQAFVFEARPDERATLFQLLEEFLAPFDGYRIRATAGNELDIAAPGWADPAAETLVLTQADLAPDGQTSQRTADIVNACEVTVQGFTFVEDQPVMAPASIILRAGSSSRRRTYGVTIPVAGSTEPAEPDSGYLGILNTTLPHVPNVPYSAGSGELIWRSAVWPLADGVTAQPGSDLTVSITINIYRQVWENGAGNPPTEDMLSVNATVNLPADGSVVTVWQGTYPNEPWNMWGGDSSRGHVRMRWAAEQFGGSGGIMVEVGHQPYGNNMGWPGWRWHSNSIEILMNGTGTVWTRDPQRTTHRFGYTQADRDLVPGLGESQELYEIREKQIDMGWFDVEPEEALAVARAVVEQNYNPRVVHQLQVVPSDPDGYRARPWHLGRPALLPDGSSGRLTSWSYEEAHTPAASASRVQIEVETVERLAADRAGRTHYGRATYRVGKYGG